MAFTAQPYDPNANPVFRTQIQPPNDQPIGFGGGPETPVTRTPPSTPGTSSFDSGGTPPPSFDSGSTAPPGTYGLPIEGPPTPGPSPFDSGSTAPPSKGPMGGLFDILMQRRMGASRQQPTYTGGGPSNFLGKFFRRAQQNTAQNPQSNPFPGPNSGAGRMRPRFDTLGPQNNQTDLMTNRTL